MTPIGSAATHPTVGSPYSYLGGKTPRRLHATSAVMSVPSTMPPYCAVASSSRLIRDARNTATPPLMDYGCPIGGRFVRQLVPEQRALQVAHQLSPGRQTMPLLRPCSWQR